jgi:hypothetical protein
MKHKLPFLFLTLTALALMMLFAALLPAQHVVAQSATPVPTTSGPSNAANAFFVVCETTAIVNVTGEALAGWDIYYQVFTGATGSGTALTDVRQVSVDGTFAVSDTVTFNSGATVAAGQTASARVWMGREGNPDSVDFEFVVTDIQDGCQNPQHAPANGTNTGTGSSTTGTGTTTSSNPNANVRLEAPGGGTLNPNLQPEGDVVIGPRQTDRYRSDTPGLIFAACNNFPLADPGLVYDNDTVTIYWSWFTRTPEQMEEHLAHAIYSVNMNGAQLNNVQLSPVERRGNLYYVFYTFPVGNLRPGHYEVQYTLEWDAPVNDGFDDFGPGTDNVRDEGNCNFDVLRNPDNESVAYTGMFNPMPYPVHNIFPDD